MQNRSRLQRGILGEIDDHLHADRPVALMLSLGQTEPFVQPLSDRPGGSIADHDQTGVHVHPRHVARLRRARTVGSLIDETDADDPVVLDQRLTHRHAGPELDEPGRHEPAGHPLVELPDGKEDAVVLAEKVRDGRYLDRVVSVVGHSAQAVECSDARRTPARPDGVLEIDEPFRGHLRSHGNLGGVELRKGRPNPPRARHDSGNAEAEVVGSFEANDLQRQPRGDSTLECRLGGAFLQGLGERGEKPAGGRPESHARNVDVHALARNRFLAHAG
ncbi:MAG: hypothetical protein R3E12_10870 [Candidatus Eisenbacteria bacterium]